MGTWAGFLELAGKKWGLDGGEEKEIG